MLPKDEKPGRVATRTGLRMVVCSAARDFEENRTTVSERQADWVARRYGLSNVYAKTIADLAFGGRAA